MPNDFECEHLEFDEDKEEISVEFEPNDINWVEVSNRLIKYRELVSGTRQEFADKVGMPLAKISALESGRDRRAFGAILRYCQLCNLNLKWVLTGEGDVFGESTQIVDPLKVYKGVGVRRSCIRKDAEEGIMDDELLEFVLTIDDFKRKNNKTFPSLSEIFQIIQFLGYRKTAKKLSHIDCI